MSWRKTPSSLLLRHAPGAPHVDAGKQEQPHDVDEMPVPGGEFEAQMLRRLELAGERARKADDQEDRTDNDMGAVEAGRHEESGTVNVARIVERRVRVF